MQHSPQPAEYQNISRLYTITEELEHGLASESETIHASDVSHDMASPRSDRQSASFSFKGALRNIANRLARSGRADVHADLHGSERSESPRSIESGSSSAHLLEPIGSDSGSTKSSSTVGQQSEPPAYQPEPLEQFYNEAYGKDDPELAGARLTPSGKAFDIFLKKELQRVSPPRAADADAASLYLLFNTDRPATQIPVLQEAFQRDRNDVHDAYGGAFSAREIDYVIQANIRPWIKANLIECNPEKRLLLKKMFCASVLQDLQESRTGLTRSVGTAASLNEPLEVDESLASVGSQNSLASDEASDAPTRTASFNSASFVSSTSWSQHITAATPEDPFLSSNPGNVPANLLAFDTDPEMFSFRRLLGNTLGSVENLGKKESDVASFNVLLGHGSSVSTIPRMHQAFQHDRNELHQNLEGRFAREQIDLAITYHIHDWINKYQAASFSDTNHNTGDQFSSRVSRCLVEHGEELDIETLYAVLQAATSPSQTGCSSLDDNESISSLSSNGWGDDLSLLATAAGGAKLASLLPKANSPSLLGSRSSERARLFEVAKNFSWFAEPISTFSPAGRTYSGARPIVDVQVLKQGGIGSSLSVRFTASEAKALVDNKVAAQVQAASIPQVLLSGTQSLDAMFLAQLDNSGINKHLYHKTLKHGANDSFRLSAQAHGGLMTKPLPFMGLRKSLEQKALGRVDARGGNRLSAVTDYPRQFTKSVDKAFLTYMASQQALWNKIKPHQLAGNQLYTVTDTSEPIHFNLLHQIGFSQTEPRTDHLVQMGKLVMSAVGAGVVRSTLSDADIQMLYPQGATHGHEPLPLNAEQFRASLGPGRLTRSGEKNYGNLGSQVIDLMARLNSKPGTPASLKEHQMMGNLLTLMVKRQASLETPAAIQKTGVPRQADPFKDVLIVNWKHNLVDKLRGLAPANRIIRDDESMINVCVAATHAVNRAFTEIAHAGIVGNAPFVEKLKDVLRNHAGFYAALDSGLADDIPNLTSENRAEYLVGLVNYFANSAGGLVERSIPADRLQRDSGGSGTSNNRHSEIQPA